MNSDSRLLQFSFWKASLGIARYRDWYIKLWNFSFSTCLSVGGWQNSGNIFYSIFRKERTFLKPVICYSVLAGSNLWAILASITTPPTWSNARRRHSKEVPRGLAELGEFQNLMWRFWTLIGRCSFLERYWIWCFRCWVWGDLQGRPGWWYKYIQVIYTHTSWFRYTRIHVYFKFHGTWASGFGIENQMEPTNN